MYYRRTRQGGTHPPLPGDLRGDAPGEQWGEKEKPCWKDDGTKDMMSSSNKLGKREREVRESERERARESLETVKSQ